VSEDVENASHLAEDVVTDGGEGDPDAGNLQVPQDGKYLLLLFRQLAADLTATRTQQQCKQFIYFLVTLEGR